MLEEDFKEFNLQIEKMKENHITRIRDQSDALKEKAFKISENMASP